MRPRNILDAYGHIVTNYVSHEQSVPYFFQPFPSTLCLFFYTHTFQIFSFEFLIFFRAWTYETRFFTLYLRSSFVLASITIILIKRTNYCNFSFIVDSRELNITIFMDISLSLYYSYVQFKIPLHSDTSWRPSLNTISIYRVSGVARWFDGRVWKKKNDPVYSLHRVHFNNSIVFLLFFFF